MRFGKLMGKNVFFSMIVCSVTSFSLLHADNLEECESEEDKQAGCVEKVYDDNGNLTMEQPYKNGVLHGIGKMYYGSGILEAEMPVKNGKVEGIYKRYYESGSLSAEKAFKNGKAEGIGKQYYEDGNLGYEIPFKNDKREGVAKVYYPNGDIFAEIPYTNDKINGMIKCYNEEKRLIWQATAQNGKIISGKCVSGKVTTNAHLARLTNEIDEFEIGGDYWYDICKQ